MDSVRGVELMTSTLAGAGRRRPVDVCVEVGMAGGRTGCRGEAVVDEVARAAAASPRLRLVGVAGYEAALGHDVGPDGLGRVRAYPGGDARGGGAAGADCSRPTASSSPRAAAHTSTLVADVLTGWPRLADDRCAAGAT